MPIEISTERNCCRCNVSAHTLMCASFKCDLCNETYWLCIDCYTYVKECNACIREYKIDILCQ